jgi:hypothetical protein
MENDVKYGSTVAVALMDQPNVTEDPPVELGFKKYEPRAVEFGNTDYPLNLYGFENKYMKFPEIGEMVRAGE